MCLVTSFKLSFSRTFLQEGAQLGRAFPNSLAQFPMVSFPPKKIQNTFDRSSNQQNKGVFIFPRKLGMWMFFFFRGFTLEVQQSHEFSRIQKWLEMARFFLLLTWHIFTVRNPSFGMMWLVGLSVDVNVLFCHILDLHSIPKILADTRKCSACSAFDANTPDLFKSSSKSL